MCEYMLIFIFHVPINEFLFQRRREECERKARRGEMDPRLEFTFQLLIDHTGLPRNAVMDHVFESNMVTSVVYKFATVPDG